MHKEKLGWVNPRYVSFTSHNTVQDIIFIIENHQGCTMLHIATESHNEQVVLELLGRGASPDIVSKVKHID